MNIFLDMDGVCCDWMTPALRIAIPIKRLKAGTDTPVLSPDDLEEQIKQDITRDQKYDPYGLREKDFWDALAKKNKDWWYNLNEYRHYLPMLELLNRRGKVTYLSSPPYGKVCGDALAGKSEWLQNKDRHGSEFRDFNFTPQKHQLAGKGRVLIDDSRTQCERFIRAGGQAILFPQHWNNYAPLTSHGVVAFLTAVFTSGMLDSKDTGIITTESISF